MKMANSSFSFHLDIIDRAIVDAVRSAVEDVMPEIMLDHNLQERNGYGQFRWNVIIAQLREKCRHLGWLELGICPRGGWKTPVLFHPASRNIITLMREDTFCRVQRRTDKGKHYLCGGSSFNQNVEAQYEQLELRLPGVSLESEQWVARSREELAHAVCTDVGEIEGHILVLFDVHGEKLLTVRAVRLTHDLAISTEEENWSKYIRMPYATSQTVEPQYNVEEDEDVLVELL